MGGRSRPTPNIIPTHNRLYASIALESCIHSSAYIEKHYLGYFDFLAQVISFRKAINHVTSKSVHVLRVWDGYVARNERQNYKASWTVDLGQESLIVPPAPKFRNIPENYYYDVILYGNWIQHAVSLKSGDTVILKNLHFFLRKGNRCSALVLHEGNAFGRDIIKIEPELFNRHYRCVKLKNDLCDVLDEHYKRECTNEECTPRGQFHIHKNVEVATLNEQDKGSLTLSLEEGHLSPKSLVDVAENLCKGCDRDARLTDNVTKSKLISQYGDEDCTSPDHSQHNVDHIAVTTDQDSASIVLSPEKEISPRRFAALAEIFYKRRDVDVQPTYAIAKSSLVPQHTNKECALRDHSQRNVDVAETNGKDNGLIALSPEKDVSPRRFAALAEIFYRGRDVDVQRAYTIAKSSLVSQHTNEECISPDHSQCSIDHVALTTDQDNASIVLSLERKVSPRRFAALAEIFYGGHNVDVRPTTT